MAEFQDTHVFHCTELPEAHSVLHSTRYTVLTVHRAVAFSKGCCPNISKHETHCKVKRRAEKSKLDNQQLVYSQVKITMHGKPPHWLKRKQSSSDKEQGRTPVSSHRSVLFSSGKEGESQKLTCLQARSYLTVGVVTPGD